MARWVLILLTIAAALTQVGLGAIPADEICFCMREPPPRHHGGCCSCCEEPDAAEAESSCCCCALNGPECPRCLKIRLPDDAGTIVSRGAGWCRPAAAPWLLASPAPRPAIMPGISADRAPPRATESPPGWAMIRSTRLRL